MGTRGIRYTKGDETYVKGRVGGTLCGLTPSDDCLSASVGRWAFAESEHAQRSRNPFGNGEDDPDVDVLAATRKVRIGRRDRIEQDLDRSRCVEGIAKRNSECVLRVLKSVETVNQQSCWTSFRSTHLASRSFSGSS